MGRRVKVWVAKRRVMCAGRYSPTLCARFTPGRLTTLA
jgi:hypothetical protein